MLTFFGFKVFKGFFGLLYIRKITTQEKHVIIYIIDVKKHFYVFFIKV